MAFKWLDILITNPLTIWKIICNCLSDGFCNINYITIFLTFIYCRMNRRTTIYFAIETS